MYMCRTKTEARSAPFLTTATLTLRLFLGPGSWVLGPGAECLGALDGTLHSIATMAAIDGFDARVTFLREAARLLAIPSPSVSAIVGAERNRLVETQDMHLRASMKEWNALRRESCGACGNTFIPRWSCEVSHESGLSGSKKRSKRGTLKRPNRGDKAVVYTCLRCHRRTVQPLQTRPPKHTKNAVRVPGTEEPGIPSTDADRREQASSSKNNSKRAKSVNASSKQRAKARKGGLQALVAKNNAQFPAGGGLGLDLMDFMQ